MRTHRPLLLGALAAAALLVTQASLAFVSVGVSINIAPPALPVYEQPAMPDVGYLWSPGYWAYSDDSGYYWVPGTWVEPPQPGYLWTPGYWGWGSGAYLWHQGYWGTQVGFYGGVNYGFGYGGAGFEGGYWRGGQLFYNRSVTNIPSSVHVTNVYNKTVINNVTVNRVSFNGGTGGTQAHATEQEMAAERAPHLMPVAAQVQHEQAAHNNPDLRNSVNHGHPAVAATARPGEFSGQGVIAAHGAANVSHGAARENDTAAHSTSLNRHDSTSTPRTDNTTSGPRGPGNGLNRAPNIADHTPAVRNNASPDNAPRVPDEHAQQSLHPAVHAPGGGGGHPNPGGGAHPGGGEHRGGGGKGPDDHH